MEKTLIFLAGHRTLTIIHRVTEGAWADHTLGSVCQGQGATHGGGVVELEGGVLSGNAVRTGDPWGVGCRGTHCKRREQGKDGSQSSSKLGMGSRKQEALYMGLAARIKVGKDKEKLNVHHTLHKILYLHLCSCIGLTSLTWVVMVLWENIWLSCLFTCEIFFID